MSKKAKVLIGIGLFFIISVAGAFYYVSTLINPEDVKKLATQTLNEAFPNAHSEIGSIDLSLGITTRLKLKKLNMQLKSGNDRELVKLEDLYVNIPIWSVIFGGSALEIKLDSPSLHFYESKESNNWKTAMGGGAKSSGPSAKKGVSGSSQPPASLAIPGFLSKSRVDVSVLNLVVNYKLKDKKRGKVNLNKFLLKNVNFESPTALEISSAFNYEMNPKEHVAFKTLVIGEINLSDIIQKKDFTSVLLIKLNDIELSSFQGQIPEIKTDLNISVSQNGRISGKLKTQFENHNVISAAYSIANEDISITDLSTALYLTDILKVAHFSMPGLNVQGNVLKLEGGLVVKNGNIYPNLTMSLSPGIKLQQNGVDLVIQSSGGFNKTRLKSTTTVKALEGQAIVDVTGNIDLNSKKFDMAKIDPLKIDFTVAGMKLSKEFLQKMLYGQNKKASSGSQNGTSESGASEVKSQAKKTTPMVLIPARIKLGAKDLVIGKNPLQLNGNILMTPNSIASKDLQLNFSRGVTKTIFTAKLQSDAIDTNFNVDVKNFDFRGLQPFLPPMVEGVSGNFTGKVNGSASLKNNGVLTHNVFADLRAHDGEIKGLGVNASEYVTRLTSTLPVLKGKLKDEYKITDGFKKLEVKGRFKHTLYQLERFELMAEKEKYNASGSGNLSPLGKTSELFVNFKDKGLVSQNLQKVSNTDTLPMKLMGPGFSLKPDVGYTTQKLAKSVAQKQVRKATKKAVDKILKNNDAKKLLKKFKLFQ